MHFGSPDEMWWEGPHMEARLAIKVDGRRVVGRITKEALTDDLGADRSNYLSALETAKAHYDRLIDCWQSMIARDELEADGSVLIRSADLAAKPER